MVENKKKTREERKVEKQLIKIILFFAVLVIVFFLATWVFNKISKIEYEGLTFTKEKFGGLKFYHYYYYFEGDNGQVNRYNLYLRNDPRYNNVPLAQENPIIFRASGSAESEALITINTPSPLTNCSESYAAIGTLAGFLSDNGIEVSSAVMNPVEAVLQNRTYATCQTKSNVSNLNVLQVTSGEETRIDIEGRCHTITVGPDCEAMKAVEKYILQAILDARANP